jgi:osmotically-inducible protein OsmY
MKLFFPRITLVIASMATLMLMPACKSKVKDTDVKTSVETALTGNPDYSGVAVNITDGVATLTGQVKDEATKAAAESTAKGIKGVKSVVNNITVMAAPEVTITPDDPLTTAVKDAVKDHPGVMATVNDGVITLTGEIQKSDLPRLMQKLSALKPKKIDNQLTTK